MNNQHNSISKRERNSIRIRRLSILALLSAIVLLMSFTPIGYLRIGPVSITFLTIPVIIGGIVLGPLEGAFLGLIFGATSFSQCFGADLLGTALLNYNLFFTILMCFVPRILIGVSSSLFYRLFSKIFLKDSQQFGNIYNKIRFSFPYIFSSFIGCITNTVLFTGLMLSLFWNTPEIQAFGNNFLTVFFAMFTLNVFIEIAVCLIISAALSKVIHMFTKKFAI